MTRLAAFAADWHLTRYISRRAQRFDGQWLVLRVDGSLWTAPQAQLQAIVDGFFSVGACDRDLYRVRVWRGLHAASSRVAWRPQGVDDFRLFWRSSIFAVQ